MLKFQYVVFPSDIVWGWGTIGKHWHILQESTVVKLEKLLGM